MAEGRSQFEAVADEWFVEPVAATDFLLKREEFPSDIWDPACGQGNVLQAAHDHGYARLVGSDIVDRRLGRERFIWTALDFLSHAPLALGEFSIICNPPFGRAKLGEAFIRRAHEVGADKIAIFVSQKFIFGGRRAVGLHRELPPARVYPIFPRPSCPPGEKLRTGEVEAKGGVENFVWLVYEPGQTKPGETRFVW